MAAETEKKAKANKQPKPWIRPRHTVVRNILYYTLGIVTSPMIASHHWAMTLFAWACLLMASLRQLRSQ